MFFNKKTEGGRIMSQKRDMTVKSQEKPPREVFTVVDEESVTLAQALNQMNNGTMLAQAKLTREERKSALLLERLTRIEAENRRLRTKLVTVESERVRFEEACKGLKRENVRVKKECKKHKEGCKKLKKIADTDALTGVYNRRYLDKTATEIITTEVRAMRSWGVLMIDIDYFKRCNDDHGHAVGDDVLKNVAQMLSEITRIGDFVVRYGGEEFCVLLFDIEENELKTVAERYRKAIASTSTRVEHKFISVTVSIGACFVPSDSTKDLKSVIVLADNALYEAKDSGRNCVVLHDMRKHSCCIREERRE